MKPLMERRSSMSLRWLAVVLVSALILTLAALGGRAVRAAGDAPSSQAAETAVGPPDITYGEARCANCNMFVREPGHAAALIGEEGARAFCDIGCLLIYMKKQHPDGAGVQATYVRDWPSGEWTDGLRAFFTQAKAWTPMRFGLFAFRDAESASAFALDNDGRTLTLQEATHHAMSEMMKRKGHGEGHGGD